MSVCCLVHVFRKPGELLAARERHTHTHTHTAPTNTRAGRQRERARSERASERGNMYAIHFIPGRIQAGRPPPCTLPRVVVVVVGVGKDFMANTLI